MKQKYMQLQQVAVILRLKLLLKMEQVVDLIPYLLCLKTLDHMIPLYPITRALALDRQLILHKQT